MKNQLIRIQTSAKQNHFILILIYKQIEGKSYFRLHLIKLHVEENTVIFKLYTYPSHRAIPGLTCIALLPIFTTSKSIMFSTPFCWWCPFIRFRPPGFPPPFPLFPFSAGPFLPFLQVCNHTHKRFYLIIMKY